MAIRTVPFKVMNFTSIDEHMTMIEMMLNYLEKTNAKDLGDFTPIGKSANAGYNNYTVYWDWYKILGYGNLQAQPYCAGFVSTTLAMSYGLEIAKKLLCGDLYVYCPDGYNRFNANKLIFKNPKRGDIVFFWSDSLGRWGHTGFVFDVDNNGKGYTTIEANTTSGNDVVVRNGGATCRKHYTLGQRKVAFGRPSYEKYGISLSKPLPELIKYPIVSGIKGLVITADLINIRSIPGDTTSKTIIKTLKRGDAFYPTDKTFVNGAPWIYDKNHGWMSAKYVEGWIQELTSDGKWWYVLSGYSYPVNKIYMIDGKSYYFDASGYMFRGNITFKTNEDGVLILDELE